MEKKLPRDTNQLAKSIVDQATEEKGRLRDRVPETLSREELISLVKELNAEIKILTLSLIGFREAKSRGGKAGGKARAEKLTEEQRSEIAKKAAKKRWGEK